MGQGSQLVQVFAPGTQFREDRLELLHHIDGMIQGCIQQILLLAQPRALDLCADLPPLGWGYPEGDYLVSGSRCHTFSPPHKNLVCCRSLSGNDNIPKIFVDSQGKRAELRESYQLRCLGVVLILFPVAQVLRCGGKAQLRSAESGCGLLPAKRRLAAARGKPNALLAPPKGG